jgi:hypothetical protein
MTVVSQSQRVRERALRVADSIAHEIKQSVAKNDIKHISDSWERNAKLLWLPETQSELETRKSCLHADTLCRRN